MVHRWVIMGRTWLSSMMCSLACPASVIGVTGRCVLELSQVAKQMYSVMLCALSTI